MLAYEVMLYHVKEKDLLPKGAPEFRMRRNNTQPSMVEIMINLREYCISYKIDTSFIEENCLIFVDAYENGLFSDPEIYEPDFSIIKSY